MVSYKTSALTSHVCMQDLRTQRFLAHRALADLPGGAVVPLQERRCGVAPCGSLCNDKGCKTPQATVLTQ